MLPVSLGILALVGLAIYLDWDAKVVAAGFLLLGLISNAFVWVLGLIALCRWLAR